MPRRLTKEQQDAIVACYVADVSIAKIAKAFKVHQSYPGILAQRQGHEKRPQTRFSTGRPRKERV